MATSNASEQKFVKDEAQQHDRSIANSRSAVVSKIMVPRNGTMVSSRSEVVRCNVPSSNFTSTSSSILPSTSSSTTSHSHNNYHSHHSHSNQHSHHHSSHHHSHHSHNLSGSGSGSTSGSATCSRGVVTSRLMKSNSCSSIPASVVNFNSSSKVSSSTSSFDFCGSSALGSSGSINSTKNTAKSVGSSIGRSGGIITIGSNCGSSSNSSDVSSTIGDNIGKNRSVGRSNAATSSETTVTASTINGCGIRGTNWGCMSGESGVSAGVREQQRWGEKPEVQWLWRTALQAAELTSVALNNAGTSSECTSAINDFKQSGQKVNFRDQQYAALMGPPILACLERSCRMRAYLWKLAREAYELAETITSEKMILKKLRSQVANTTNQLATVRASVKARAAREGLAATIDSWPNQSTIESQTREETRRIGKINSQINKAQRAKDRALNAFVNIRTIIESEKYNSKQSNIV